jgi:hypothetical protein
MCLFTEPLRLKFASLMMIASTFCWIISTITPAKAERCCPLHLTSGRSFCKVGIGNLCVRCALPCFRSFQNRQRVDEQNRLEFSRRSIKIYMFSGGCAVDTRLCVSCGKDITHLMMVYCLGMFPWRPILKRREEWVSVID